MNAYILLDVPDLRPDALLMALGWLEEQGGGTLYSETKDDLCSILKVDTEQRFLHVRDNLESRGIKLAWRKKKTAPNGNVVAAYVRRHHVEEITKCGRLNNLLVLAWGDEDWSSWIKENEATQLVIKPEE